MKCTKTTVYEVVQLSKEVYHFIKKYLRVYVYRIPIKNLITIFVYTIYIYIKEEVRERIYIWFARVYVCGVTIWIVDYCILGDILVELQALKKSEICFMKIATRKPQSDLFNFS